jgi:hypothetical protein
VPVKIRILSAANKHMQRLGYLKLLASRVARVETSSLSALGKPMVETVTKRVRVSPPFSEPLREYAQIRLSYDKIYTDLRDAILSGKSPVSVELQDLYLSDPELPSSTGKLGGNSERFYPYLGTALDLIKPGTWSAMTRSLLLIHLTPKEEAAAWDSHQPRHNPLKISSEQAAVLFYCFLDNDAEVLLPLFAKLLELNGDGFDERTAGDYLPAILRNAISTLSKSSLAVEDRERLAQLDKAAKNIERWHGKPYTGGGAREENIRVRIEPFCDLGLFTKPDRHRFAYRLTPAFKRLMANLGGTEIDYFLENRFFTTLAAMRGITAKAAGETEIRNALREAGETLSSTLGYSPIRDCSLLAGIRLLFDHQRVLELGTSLNALRDWQKAAPDIVRFTVDRMGEMAYVKFLKPAAPPTPSKP